MKINTFVKYNFTADIYVKREANDLNGTIEYIYAETRPVNIVSGRQQTYMYTQENVEWGAKVLMVLNPKGEQLFLYETEAGPNPYDMFIHASDPVIDVYGNIVGYRQVLRRTEPTVARVSQD